MIETEELCVSIGKKRIVDHSTIHVDEGEFVGLIGPNGSGKSTMLKAIYRTLEPESGTITVNGVMLRDSSLRESALNLAVVSQHNYYNFDFMVEEVVMMGRTPHKKSMEMDNEEDRRIVDESLEKVGMSDFKGRKFSSLSGGEQQRIILARALTQMSPCLVLDEPTNHLDVKYQLDVLDIVKGLGSTVLCALHDLNLAAQYCDRIYILEGGRVRHEGSPYDVITEDVIQEVYGVKSSVEVHPKTGLLNVVYYPRHSSGF